VFGYFGFKTEYSLREAFANFLGEKTNINRGKGFGVGSLPSLVICGRNSLIKNNGMPYAMAFGKEDFYWPIYVSSRDNPIYHLLEIVWTRLSYKFKISSSIFGEDFDFDSVHRFINCKFGKDDNGKPGWMYSYSPFCEKSLSETNSDRIGWSPKFLTQKQFAVILQLCQHEFINYVEDLEFIENIKKDGIKVQDFITCLISTGLVYERNNEVRLLTYECQTLILPDGRFCAGENKNGEMARWLYKYLQEKKNPS
jgi:hypothetical protein